MMNELKVNQSSDGAILVVDDNHFNIIAMNLMLEQAFNNLKLISPPRLDSAVDGIDGIEKMHAKAVEYQQKNSISKKKKVSRGLSILPKE